MTDRFRDVPVKRSDPATGIFTVTPSDAADQPHMIRYFRVGTTAGNVVVVSRNGEQVTIPNVQIGETIVGDVRAIKATGTTAVGITAWY